MNNVLQNNLNLTDRSIISPPIGSHHCCTIIRLQSNHIVTHTGISVYNTVKAWGLRFSNKFSSLGFFLAFVCTVIPLACLDHARHYAVCYFLKIEFALEKAWGSDFILNFLITKRVGFVLFLSSEIHSLKSKGVERKKIILFQCFKLHTF